MENYSTISPYITKSKFTRGFNCPLATKLCLTRPQDAAPIDDINYILDNGSAVGVLARQLYPDAVTIEHSSCIQQAEETMKLIATGTHTICEASFLHDRLFCAADILEVTSEGHLIVNEVKSASVSWDSKKEAWKGIKDVFYYDLAFQVYVILKRGYKVDEINLILVNSEYVREEEIDPKKFFIKINVTADVLNMLESIEQDLAAIETATVDNTEISECCMKPYKCPFWDSICSKKLPANNIFDIRGMFTSTKVKLFRKGIQTMENFLNLEKQNPNYVQQARCEVYGTNENEVNYDALRAFLEKIPSDKPISSLDFETLNEAIPLFVGQKPYAQTPFQYSLHILRKLGGVLEHFEYLADQKNGDWRVDLSHELVKSCPAEGIILVWNEAMEKNRILEFAELPGNEDIKEQLISMAERMVDLMVPFRERVIYNRMMKGSYSVKYVLPALCPNNNLSYKELPINNGMLASKAFASLVHTPNMPLIEATTIKRSLLSYCELDTYGPLLILDEMFKIADENAIDLFQRVETRRDNGHKAIRVADRVITNIGTGSVIGYTPCFVKVALDAGYNVIRKPHNLYDMSYSFEVYKNSQFASAEPSFIDVTGREVKIGDYVVTKSTIGQVIGRTTHFLKIKLANGKTVLRKTGNFVIITSYNL